jgi:Uma2 family endonuclease
MATEVRGSLEVVIRDLSERDSAWGAGQVFPVRYPCTEKEYFALDFNLLLEFADGFLEVLPMPTTYHQRVSAFLYKALDAWITAGQLREVLFAPLQVRLRKGKVREPDLVFMKSEHAARIRNQYWRRPDLVIEIVSPKNRRHDLVTKRDEYAEAGIPEYWIVDPQRKTITVLVLMPRAKTYSEHGTFTKGTRAASLVLPGFTVDVTETFARRP